MFSGSEGFLRDKLLVFICAFGRGIEWGLGDRSARPSGF
jgi:hypothetical protein